MPIGLALMKPFIAGLALALCWGAAIAETAKFDLGGPCSSGAPSGPHLRDVVFAEKAGDWPRLIESSKKLVRDMCHKPITWVFLADAYLAAGDEANAAAVLAEMYRRGFEVEPSHMRLKKRVAEFLVSDAFRATAFGRSFGTFRDTLAARRKLYRQTIAAIPQGKRPPATFVAKPACPFECCVFREWTVKADVALVDKPFGKATVGMAKAGETVQAETGEVHTEPVPLGVAHDFEKLKKGDVFYVLNYSGEGFFSLWHDGKVAGTGELRGDSYCVRPGKSCRTETVFPRHEGLSSRRHEWWVRVKTKRGVTGWTRETKKFGNMDACG